MLDELDELALLLARETGRPRTEAVLGELLPTVAGLSELADDGPRRARRPPARPARAAARGPPRHRRPGAARRGRGARRRRLAVDGARAGGRRRAAGGQRRPARAGRAARRASGCEPRSCAAGMPDELLAVAHGEEAAAALDGRVRARRLARRRRPRKGAMLVLEGAPVEPVAAARAVGGVRRAAAHHPRPCAGSSSCPSRRRAAARGGAARARGAAAGRRPDAARARGDRPAALGRATSRPSRRSCARRSAAAPSSSAAARPASRAAPALLRARACCGACPPARGSCASPSPARCSPSSRRAGEAAAIALVQDGADRASTPATAAPAAASSSVWAGDRAKGERVARTLGAELTWVNEHGAVAPGPALRLAAPRRPAPGRLAPGAARRRPPPAVRSASLVRARTAAARLVHGREADRLRVLRREALPRAMARAALRVGAGLLRRALRERRLGREPGAPAGFRRGRVALCVPGEGTGDATRRGGATPSVRCRFRAHGAGQHVDVPIAIVTGGNSGIGRAAAVALAERGYDVGITWHAHEDRAQEALEEIRAHGVRAEARKMDLDEGFPDDARAVDELIDALGGIDALVNNAGAG